MGEKKYIIVLDLSRDGEFPVLFPKQLIHRDIAFRYTAVSAGFWFMDKNGKVTVYGNSDSLGLNSRPEDAAIIEKYLSPS